MIQLECIKREWWDTYRHLQPSEERSPSLGLGGYSRHSQLTDKYRKGNALSVEGILSRISYLLYHMKRWVERSAFEEATKHRDAIEVLLQVVEVHFYDQACSEFGNMDAIMPHLEKHWGLLNRWRWLMLRNDLKDRWE